MSSSFSIFKSSLALAVLLSFFPTEISATTRPLESTGSPYLRVQYSPETVPTSGTIGGLELTGCTPVNGDDTALCFQWLGDALTTCLDWKKTASITACIGQTSGFPLFQNDNSHLTDWGFSLDIHLP